MTKKNKIIKIILNNSVFFFFGMVSLMLFAITDNVINTSKIHVILIIFSIFSKNWNTLILFKIIY